MNAGTDRGSRFSRDIRNLQPTGRAVTRILFPFVCVLSLRLVADSMTELQIIVIDSDAARVAASRKRFHAAGRMFLQTGNELHVISNDEGLTWDTDRVVVLRNDGAGYDLGYPRSMQLDDGTILTVYYFTDDEQVTHVACTRWRVPDRP